MSKRNAAGKVTSPLGLECLPLSRTQLRDMWDYDNECGYRIMGAPLRTCTCREDGLQVQDMSTGISSAEIQELKKTIKDMWIKADTLFQVFYDPKCPELGYRMKVKDNLPLKVTLREDNNFFFGWCAFAPEMGSCSHLYNRSPVDPNGYMGGPASLCNWVQGKEATVSISRPINRSVRYMARLNCRNLARGQELLWNYGCNKKMPVEADWSKECCRITPIDKTLQRQLKRQNLTEVMHKELCVLCGKQYPMNNKECRFQRKPHFINSHADFFGSTWNGVGPYMQQEVDAESVLIEADKLNALLQTLKKDLRWSVVPACNVMSLVDQDEYEDPTALLKEFHKRCDLLKAAGIVVLRGAATRKAITDFSIDHLKPIPVSVWRTLTWKNKKQPPAGIYGVPNDSADHAAAVQASIVEFCLKSL